MKKISGNGFKEVDYFGIMLVIPNNIKYLATTPDSIVVGSDGKPRLDPVLGWLYKFEDFTPNITKVDLEGMDWKDTLVEV